MERYEMVLVQFCPCGCVCHMPKEEMIAAGAGRQLELIESGAKVDALIQPSDQCPDCQADREWRDRDWKDCLEDSLLSF